MAGLSAGLVSYVVGRLLAAKFCIGGGSECAGSHAAAPTVGLVLQWLAAVFVIAGVAWAFMERGTDGS